MLTSATPTWPGRVFISPTDPEKAFQYVKACIGDTVDDAMCPAFGRNRLLPIGIT